MRRSNLGLALVLLILGATACGNTDTDPVEPGPFASNVVGDISPTQLDCGEHFEAALVPEYGEGAQGSASPLEVIESESDEYESLPRIEDAATTVNTDQEAETAYLAQVIVSTAKGEPRVEYTVTRTGTKDTWLLQRVRYCTDQVMPKEAKN